MAEREQSQDRDSGINYHELTRIIIKYQGTMTLEELNEGNSLIKQIIDAENELRELEEWQKIIEEDDEMVWLSSKEKTGRRTKSICILHGKKVLPLIQERIEEIKERLKEKRTIFEKL